MLENIKVSVPASPLIILFDELPVIESSPEPVFKFSIELSKSQPSPVSWIDVVLRFTVLSISLKTAVSVPSPPYISSSPEPPLK